MSGLIPQRFIDDLLSRVDIVDVVDSRVKLRKTGKNYSGLCPFHQEKSPSFSVQPEKQFYYCFGCGAGGNALGFLMNFENMDFPQAVELLAKDMGLEVPREEGTRGGNKAASSRHEALLLLLNEVSQWYQLQLRQHPQKARPVDYLKARGLSGQIARDFGIGYAPPGWDNLFRQFGTDDSRKRQLLDTGMLIENPENQKNPLYDRFRDRIMYPIRDSRGRVLGFGGRVLGNDKPKYLNSPETAVFRKGEELYGLFEAKQKLKKPTRFLIVEGYMDVIALAQHGIHYCVATLGTATSAIHLRTLFKLAPEVVFSFDGDNAGRDAAWRALQVALPLMEDGRSARFLFLPEGQDPDTQVRRIGAAAFEASLNSATRFVDFFYDTLCARLDINSFEGKAQLGKLALPLLDKLPTGIFKQLMLDQLSKLTGVSVADLKAQQASKAANTPGSNKVESSGRMDSANRMESASNTGSPNWSDSAMANTNAGSQSHYPYYHDDSPPPSSQSPPQPWQPRGRPAQQRIRVELSPCMKAVNLLISKPEIIQTLTIPRELGELEALDLDLLMKVIEIAKAAPDSSPPELMSRIYATDYGSHLTQLLGRELITPEEGIGAEFKGILDRLVLEHRKRQDRYTLLETLRQRHAQREDAADQGQQFDK